MAEVFEQQDLSGAVFWGVNLSGARLRDVNLTHARIQNAWLLDVDIDALIDNVTINGVDVTDYVNERDPWYPLRAMLRPDDAEAMRTTWIALEDHWTTTIGRARELPEERLHESVDGEWSFVQTLRHIVFAIDKWFTAPILGHPFHPIVLANSGSDDLEWPGRDRGADPNLDQALDVRADRVARVREYLAAVTPHDLTREVEVLENGTTPVRECFFVVFEEAFEHNRYALRDLAALEASA